MRGHTRKFLISSQTVGIYEVRIYSSGNKLHTVEINCNLNGRTERHSFRGRGCAERFAEKFTARTEQHIADTQSQEGSDE